MDWFSSSIRSSDAVVFFPTFAHYVDEKRHWLARIHGWVFHPDERAMLRLAMLTMLRRGLKLEREHLENELFKRRLRPFLVDNKAGRRISIRVGETDFDLSRTESSGHFQHAIELPDQLVARTEIATLTGDASGNGRQAGPPWLEYRAVTSPKDERLLTGLVQLIGPEGISVISDIDDTLKITGVASKREVLRTTFLREFEAVPEMAAVFQHWAQRGATFHYVSSSPWQLYEPLSGLLEREGFPLGTWHLREFRLRRRGSVEALSGSEVQKRKIIGEIFALFPERKFILVGDSGERDPEIYADFARQFPGRVLHICIHKADGLPATPERFAQTFAGLPEDLWTVFDDARELAGRPVCP